MNSGGSFWNSSLVQLTATRFRLFFREPEAVFWIFIFPILLAVGLGIAFRNRPAEILKVGATDPAIVAQLRKDSRLSVTQLDRTAGDVALRTGRILVLAIPRPGGVTYRYDDTNPDARTARLITDYALQHAGANPDRVNTSNDLVREPGSRYIDFVIPGLLGMNLMGSAMWGLGFTIVDSRQKKLLKRMVASPMPRWEYLVAFLLSRLLLLCIEVVVFLSFATLAFGVPIRGALWQLAILCVLTSMMFSGIGLLTASRARTIEAVSGLMNLIMLPMWIFSGVFFSAERFPGVLQPIVRALPLTAAIDAIRGNMLQGTALTQMPLQLALMAGWFGVSFFVALGIFRWR